MFGIKGFVIGFILFVICGLGQTGVNDGAEGVVSLAEK